MLEVSVMAPSSVGCDSPLLGQKKGDIVCDKNKIIKCVLIGDGQVGKTSLVVSYSTNGFPSEYVPTAFDNYKVEVMVDNQLINVQLCDTAGQDDLDPLRTLCYPDTDVFLICFSVVNPESFRNVRRKWVPEIRRHWPEAPMVLVGTQADRKGDIRLLNQLAANKEEAISEKEAWALANSVGAKGYIETSALTQRQLKDAFDTAIVCALARRKLLSNNNRSKSLKLNDAGRRWRRFLCCVQRSRD